MQAGLEETYYYEPPTVTWSYASHAAIVEVDIRTGRLDIEKYVVVHDCGVVVNPMLVEGQIIGGTVQGLGGALLEEFAYDSEGQLLTGSFMDYLLPTASDIPQVELIHQHSPSPLNPLGVKGVGEGSAISPPVVIANAVSDALAPFKMEFNSTPIRPEQIAAACVVGCGSETEASVAGASARPGPRFERGEIRPFFMDRARWCFARAWWHRCCRPRA